MIKCIKVYVTVICIPPNDTDRETDSEVKELVHSYPWWYTEITKKTMFTRQLWNNEIKSEDENNMPWNGKKWHTNS